MKTNLSNGAGQDIDLKLSSDIRYRYFVLAAGKGSKLHPIGSVAARPIGTTPVPKQAINDDFDGRLSFYNYPYYTHPTVGGGYLPYLACPRRGTGSGRYHCW